MNLPTVINEVKQTLQNPLVITSLVLGVAGAPLLYYAGKHSGEPLEVLFLILWVADYTIDAIVTLTFIRGR